MKTQNPDISMQQWIDYHNARADKAEKKLEIAIETLEYIAAIYYVTKPFNQYEEYRMRIGKAQQALKEIKEIGECTEP